VGERVRISAKLIQVSDQTQLWAESYEHELADVFALHRDVSRRIAESLPFEALPSQQAALAKATTTDFETYRDYLKGRHFLKKRTPQELKKGVEWFQQAIERDDDYALAYAGLAEGYLLLGSTQYGPVLPPREAVPKAKAAALKALEIDDTLAEAHAMLANIRLEYDWDWKGAEEAFQRAIALNPSYPTAHRWYSLQLAKMGRMEESLEEISQARRLDPLSLIVNVGVGWHFYLARQYEQAIQQYQETLEMEPNSPLPHFLLGMAYEQTGRLEEAIAEFERALALSGGSPPMIAALGHAQALAGRQDQARNILQQLEQLSRERYVSAVYPAAIHAALGDKDRAFDWLERAYEERADYMSYLKVDPTFDSLRSDPRFQELQRRVGLPVE
jgi:tetratricopeptide (TPR) repeat protein